MFLSKANDGGVTASISTSNVLETIMSQREAPPVELWRVFQSSFSDMHSQITSLQEQLLDQVQLPELTDRSTRTWLASNFRVLECLETKSSQAKTFGATLNSEFSGKSSKTK